LEVNTTSANRQPGPIKAGDFVVEGSNKASPGPTHNKMNTAQQVKEYYSHEDFKSNYSLPLAEIFSNNEGDILNRIQTLFNISNYEVQQQYGKVKYVATKEAQAIFNHITENIEDFTTDFYGCYVGYTSLQSIAYSEQYESLENFEGQDPKTLALQFEDEGYTVIDNAAYYNLDGGLHIDLLQGDLKELLQELKLIDSE
jgi:hypothetical protein